MNAEFNGSMVSTESMRRSNDVEWDVERWTDVFSATNEVLDPVGLNGQILNAYSSWRFRRFWADATDESTESMWESQGVDADVGECTDVFSATNEVVDVPGLSGPIPLP